MWPISAKHQRSLPYLYPRRLCGNSGPVASQINIRGIKTGSSKTICCLVLDVSSDIPAFSWKLKWRKLNKNDIYGSAQGHVIIWTPCLIQSHMPTCHAMLPTKCTIKSEISIVCYFGRKCTSDDQSKESHCNNCLNLNHQHLLIRLTFHKKNYLRDYTS